MDTFRSSPAGQLALGLIGAAALGGCIAAFAPGQHSADLCGRMPLFVVVVGALTLPALYIALAYLGVAPRAAELGRAALSALGALGAVLLGLVPALCFVLATSTTRGVALVGAVGALAVGALVALRRLRAQAFAQAPAPDGAPYAAGRARRAFTFVLWCVVSAALALSLFTSLVLPEVY